MKLILKQYLASLKERAELDAVLPDLLSCMGMNVFISPTRGVKEYGVDIAAVGQINGQEKKVYLFSVKSGNLTRESWNGNTDQALRPSLDEIKDSFIPSRLPPEHRDKEIVICLCFGGDINSGIRQEVSGYETRNTRGNISYEEWNGDKLSEYIQQYLLKEELLVNSSQALLRKSLALLEEPESSSKYFSLLIDEVLSKVGDSDSVASSITRLNVCLWVLFSWCRDCGNLESAYLSSERAVLQAWDKVKGLYTGKNKASKSFDSIVDTYQQITDHYVDHCIIPFAEFKHALSYAVCTSCSIDVNIKLFDVLGRLAVKGLWVSGLLEKSCNENPPVNGYNEQQELLSLRVRDITKSITSLIVSNPILFSPYKDSQAIDIGLALLLLSKNSDFDDFVQYWLSEIVNRIIFCFESNGMYPIIHDSYEKLLEHKSKESVESNYKTKVTEASVLYPMLAVFCSIYELTSSSDELERFTREHLAHSTLQYWYPNQYSEESMYSNIDMHGSSSTNFPMNKELVLQHVLQECRGSDSFKKMSAFTEGNMSLIITACRCYRYPVPFHLLEGLIEDSIECTTYAYMLKGDNET